MKTVQKKLLMGLHGQDEKVYYSVSLERPMTISDVCREVRNRGTQISHAQIKRVLIALEARKMIGCKKTLVAGKHVDVYLRFPIRNSGIERIPMTTPAAIKSVTRSLDDMIEIAARKADEIKRSAGDIETMLIEISSEIGKERGKIKQSSAGMQALKDLLANLD